MLGMQDLNRLTLWGKRIFFFLPLLGMEDLIFLPIWGKGNLNLLTLCEVGSI